MTLTMFAGCHPRVLSLAKKSGPYFPRCTAHVQEPHSCTPAAASLAALANPQTGFLGAQVRQGAEVAHELDEWEEVHVEDAEGVGAAYTRRRTVYGKISCALTRK